jgi:hypothetical protein
MKIWYPNLGAVRAAIALESVKYDEKVPFDRLTRRLQSWCSADEVLATDWLNRFIEDQGPYYPLIKV